MITGFIGQELIERLIDAFRDVFSTSAGDAVRELLNNLRFPELDIQAMVDGFYGTFFGIGLLVGAVVTAVYLLFVIRYTTVLSLLETVFVLLRIYLFGALLPWMAQVATGLVHAMANGLVEWLTGGPYSEETFPFDVATPFGVWNSFFITAGSWALNLEFLIFTELLGPVLAIMALVFAFRYFGAFGDGLFVFIVGVAIMLVVGPLASIMILGLGYPIVLASTVFGPMLATLLILAALAPFGLLLIYVKTGMSQKVRGLMESKQLSARVSRLSGDSSEGSSSAANVAKASVIGAIAGAYLSRAAKKPDGGSDSGSRGAVAGGMVAASASLAKTNPYTAATLFVTSMIVGKGKKKAPVNPPPTQQQGQRTSQQGQQPQQPPPQRPPATQQTKGA